MKPRYVPSSRESGSESSTDSEGPRRNRAGRKDAGTKKAGAKKAGAKVRVDVKRLRTRGIHQLC